MKRVAFLLAAICACSGGGAEVQSGPTIVGGGRFRLAIAGDGRSLTLHRDAESLLAFDADAFQLGVADTDDEGASWDPYTIEQRGADAAGVTFRTPRGFQTDGASLTLDYGDGYALALAVVEHGGAGFRLGLDATGPSVVLMRVRARTTGGPNEGFYGTGEQEDSVDQRGALRTMQLEADSSTEAGYIEAHVPVPFVIGTNGWSIFFASKRIGVIDVARKDPAIVEGTFAIPDHLDVYIAGAHAPIDLVSAYYDATGPMRVPPPWALGPWIWRNDTTDQTQAEGDIAQIRALDLATSGIWIDNPYQTAVSTFDFDPMRYTDPQRLVDRAHAAGLRFALWSTPYLEAAAEPLRSEAVSKGYFPPVSALPLNPFDSAPIDFTNEDAANFWTGLAKKDAALGVDGFKLDYAEDVVPSLGLQRNKWRFASGEDERTMHWHYSSLYHRAYSDALPDDRFLLARAAHWGEQALGCVIWPGDMDATFTKHGDHFADASGKDVAGVGGLPATIVQGLSLAASGFAFFGADAGGFRHGPPTTELFTRWFEQTALSTVMQVGGATQPPWEYDAATLDVYRTYARLHTRLFPYVWTLALAPDGRPIARAFGLAHPELGVHPSDEYFFGDDLLVAPVVEAGATTRHVILPDGAWIDWWDATPYGGGAADVAAPIDRLPLLMRDGAIVPMLRPTIDTLAPADDPDVDSFARDPGALWVRIAPGQSRRFALWDGTTVERVAPGTFDVTSGAVFTSGFVLELVAQAMPNAVDGGTFVWTPDARGTLRITVPASPSTTRVVVR